MSVSVFSMPVQGERQLVQLRQRTRQIAGLLGFPTRQQAEVAAGVADYAARVLEDSDELLVEFRVDDTPGCHLFLVAIEFEGEPPPQDVTDTGIIARLDLRRGTGGRTTAVLAREFPKEAPPAAGEALARIAGELANRSRPQSAFLEIQEQNRELLGAISELSKVNRELQGYAHSVSHGLKEPLAEILLANEILRQRLEEKGRQAPDEGLRTLVDAIKENVKRSAALIDDLLALSEVGQAPAEVADVDVSRTVEAVVKERALMLEQRNARVEADEDLGTVRASPTHVYQVFSNLIGSAVKHNDRPEPVVEVRRVPGEGGEPTFVVRDNGPGIPEEDLDGIFTGFCRGQAGDFGVGLAIVEKIIELYGGHVEVFNDNGACFRFTMPGL